jgi:hypothetical protein
MENLLLLAPLYSSSDVLFVVSESPSESLLLGEPGSLPLPRDASCTWTALRDAAAMAAAREVRGSRCGAEVWLTHRCRLILYCLHSARPRVMHQLSSTGARGPACSVDASWHAIPAAVLHKLVPRSGHMAAFELSRGSATRTRWPQWHSAPRWPAMHARRLESASDGKGQ